MTTSNSVAPLPRGVRNHNPLNIRLEATNRWQGRVEPDRNTDGHFEQFTDPVWGLRAGAVLAIAHYDRRGADTIRKLVLIWAPASENDTDAYAAFVARESGFGADECLDFHRAEHLRPVLLAMIRFENGRQPYTDAEIDAALVRAGVPPPGRPLAETRTVRGGQAAATGTLGAAAIEMVQETIGPAQDALVGIAPYLEAAKWALLLVTLVGVGVMLWARIDDRRRGLR
jgi:hypothetical protein